MSPNSAQVIVCGAGIAGVSAAYFLAKHHGFRDILLLDPNPPLSVTSDKSTECYRNWWPTMEMVTLVNRSVDLMEEMALENGNMFSLSRRGYLYLSADPAKIPAMQQTAAQISALGAGPLRVYQGSIHDPDYQPLQPEGFTGQPEGADLMLDPALIRKHFPYINSDVTAALHVRRAGWLSAQQLGVYLLEQARTCGARLERAQVEGIATEGGRVKGARLSDGRQIETDQLVIAAGPLQQEVARMIGIDLPVFNELHLKAAMNDRLGVIPRSTPLLIWTDPQRLSWSPDEQAALAEDPETAWLVDEFPSGVHTRPEGGPGAATILMLWEYHTHRLQPVFPLPLDPDYPELVLRGLSKMIPGLQAYFSNFGRPVLDGGYYTKTIENLPLVGPLPLEGAYLIGALSGFGIMTGCAAGELLAAHMAGADLPSYAPAFRLERYDDPAYQNQLLSQSTSGQL